MPTEIMPPVIVSACSVLSRSESIPPGVVRADPLGASWRHGVRASELAGLAVVPSFVGLL